jgi:hypothetical protein
MKLQLYSDLHLETERFTPEPAPGAELLVLAGDIDSTWAGYERFAGWPVPVLVVAGNHEYDGRELGRARAAFERRCTRLGLTPLECSEAGHTAANGRRWRILGTTRWCDFDLFGLAQRPRSERAAAYFMRLMGARLGDAVLGTTEQRELALQSRRWLETTLARSPRSAGPDAGWDRTLVVTHFAPSLKSADPRYGATPSTAAFCNADDDLLQRADAWLHGHLHCRHDYTVARPGLRPVRVVSQARGLAAKGETRGHDPRHLIDLA